MGTVVPAVGQVAHTALKSSVTAGTNSSCWNLIEEPLCHVAEGWSLGPTWQSYQVLQVAEDVVVLSLVGFLRGRIQRSQE